MNQTTNMKPLSMLNNTTRSLGSLISGFVVAATLTMVPLMAHAEPASFTPFEVEYEVGNNMISAGSAILQLAKEGDAWVYSLKTKPTGVFKLTGKGKIQEISVFTVSDSTDKLELKPQRYTYRQDEEARRSVDAEFDWTDRELTYIKRGEETTEAFSDPVLDRLSVTLTVMDALRQSNFEQAELQVFDNGRVKTMLFANEGIETMDTKMGPVKTIRVRSNAVGGATRHTTTWFAPELDYVPVQIEQYKRDKLVARLTLTKLRNRVTEDGGAKAFLPPSK